jgi:Ca2+-binding RTX toxin-like protein
MRRVILLLTVMGATLVVASAMALAVIRQGGPGNDVVSGTERPDDLGGGFGSDTVIGLGGDDHLWGGLLPPRPGELPPAEVEPNNDDILIGGSGDDMLRPDEGSDRIIGGSGSDILTDGDRARGSYDILEGGSGNDGLIPRNEPAGKDLAVCGGGKDLTFVDRADVVVGCERVRFHTPTPAERPLRPTLMGP